MTKTLHTATLVRLTTVIALLMAAVPALANAAPAQIVPGSVGAVDPALVVDRSGAATVAWEVQAPGGQCRTLRTARVDPDGVAGPIRAFPGISDCASDVDLAVDRSGIVTAAWASSGRNAAGGQENPGVQISRFRPDGTPGKAKTIGGADYDVKPDIEVGRDGSAVVVYTGPVFGQLDPGSYRADAVRLRPNGGIVRSPLVVSRLDALDPKVVVDRKGRAAITWLTGDLFGKQRYRVQFRSITSDGRLGRLRTLSRKRSGLPDLDVSRRGLATVAWAHGGKVFARQLKPSGKLRGSARKLTRSRRRTASAPEVAVPERGRTVIAWATRKRKAADRFTVNYAALRGNGRPKRPRTLARNVRGPVLTVNPKRGLSVGVVGLRKGAMTARIRPDGNVKPGSGRDALDAYKFVRGLQLAGDARGALTVAAAVADGIAVQRAG